MVSVFPPKEKAGPREHPASVPQTLGMPEGVAEQVVAVPFNDADAAERAFQEHEGHIAGMIVEPVMTNCGVVLPDPGYLAALKEICRRNGALFAFDEVKTGFTVARGGAVEAFGVVPDLVCLAKALGAGLPCGAIGGTEEAMSMILVRRARASRHVQREPADDGRGQGEPDRGPHEGRVRRAGRGGRASSRGATT